MEFELNVLFSGGSGEEFVVLVTLSPNQNLLRIFLSEFRQRGFKRCFLRRLPASQCRRVRLFNPTKRQMTNTQVIDYQRIRSREPHYQVMYFKISWKEDKLGIEIEAEFDPTTYAVGRMLKLPPPRHFHDLFNPSEEMSEDFKSAEEKVPSEGKSHASGDKSSTSDYETKSSSVRSLGGSNLGTASSSGRQTMKSGEAVTEQSLVEDVERAVQLYFKVMGEKEHPEPGHKDIHAWLESTKAYRDIPELLTTEQLDRELGNIAEAAVGPEGAEVCVRSYKIHIPSNAVKSETRFRFRVSVEMDIPEYPSDLIPISLPLHCSPGDTDFDEKISMTISTWLRKADLSPDSPPIPIFVYTKRKGNDWECVESSELTPTGIVEFQCSHFCVNGAFIKKSDAEKVLFKIEHILVRDEHGSYTSCHFLSSDPFVSTMLEQLKRNYKIVHPPTYASLAKYGDEIKIGLECRDPESYHFESEGSCVLKVNEEFCVMNRRESFGFCLTPKPCPHVPVEFTYVIGEKRFCKRDQLTENCEGARANILVLSGGRADITQSKCTIGTSETPMESKETPQGTTGTHRCQEDTAVKEVWYDCHETRQEED